MEAEIILINGNNIRTINVIVKSKSNFYPETNQQFGISKNELIEKKEKRILNHQEELYTITI